ncbi:DNA-binding transcriptional LysR family regulator [Rhodopseudomonas julia]|uniref:DNA-binding transcriptional LysR family regulator n=1 Tax=Rhodopseudomonas julia TaxID=200617 RepID=A0ABU0C780_9BRAD|nr:LysR family transcriptional regulator [Rhodopseudomonas julia]MDQ0326381.1 DNA-binding transcriptional LysR family regulator [Rhodopseudomonas julia]
MELPSQMILFATVVESESFSAAARSLGLTPSAVSRQIGFLEDRLKVRLLNRSKHGLSLTEEGRAFYERCADLAARVSEAENLATAISGQPVGVLRVAATVAFAKAQLLPIMPEFMARYPELKVSLEVTDRPIDLAAEGIDVAIRFTEQVEDSFAVARKLARNRRVICAAPAYLKRAGTPTTRQDLAHHNCLRLSTVTRWNDWHLEGAEGTDPVPLTGNFEANSADAIYHATLSGLGIARLSTYLVGEDIKAGRLVRLLPDYADDGSDILALYSEKRNLSPRVRAFIDYLSAHFGSVPPWEREE